MAAASLDTRAAFRLSLGFVYMTNSWLGQLQYLPDELQVGGSPARSSAVADDNKRRPEHRMSVAVRLAGRLLHDRE